jgi:leucine dehydrogenase
MALHKSQKTTHTLEALMRYARLLGFGDIHSKLDPETGLHAFIAIHNTNRGPALGGTRFYEYTTAGMALKDVLRLSYMMTLKAAINNLSHGGGKAVIIKPKIIKDREALFRSFGDFVHEQNGRYIAAIDVGTKTEDMDVVATRTPYVIGASHVHEGHQDPAIHTALGVFRSIQAAVLFKLNKDSLKGLHIAIQGAGHVGYALAKSLHEQDAIITMCDPDEDALRRCVNEFKIKTVACDKIYDVDCDIFSPCAMGGIIDLDTINKLKCSIIVGSANNQLAHNKYADVLKDRNILYGPDFLVNSGGLINAALVYDSNDQALALQHIMNIYDTCLELFERSKNEDLATTVVAEKTAIEKLG